MLHPACDLDTAKKVARELGAEHVVIQVDELEMEGNEGQSPERAYLCKNTSLRLFLDFAREKGITCILDGTNEDDTHVYRPGIRALKELGIISPSCPVPYHKAAGKGAFVRLWHIGGIQAVHSPVWLRVCPMEQSWIMKF